VNREASRLAGGEQLQTYAPYESRTASRYNRVESAGPQLSSQQSGPSLKRASLLAPGSHRFPERPSSNRNNFGYGGLGLWNDTIPSQEISASASTITSRDLPSSIGSSRNGALPIRRANDLAQLTEFIPLRKLSDKVNPDAENMIRPTPSRHNSDHSINFGLSKLSVTVDETSLGAFPPRRSSAFATSGQLLEERSSESDLDNLAHFNHGFATADLARRQLSANHSNHIQAFEHPTSPRVVGNPQATSFLPRQFLVERHAWSSQNGNWPSDSQFLPGGSKTQAFSGSYEPTSVFGPLPSQSRQQYQQQYQQPQQIHGSDMQNLQTRQAQSQMSTIQQMHMMQMQQLQQIHQFQMQPFSTMLMGNMPMGNMPMSLPQISTFQMPRPEITPPASSSPTLNRPLGQDYMSPVVREFRNTHKLRKWELSDFVGHLVELSGDQNGSRWLQSFLETASTQDKTKVFNEIFPNAWALMQDVFGNYVIQKFFEFGDQVQKRKLGDLMQGRVPAMTTNMYGCRVVQKAIEHLLAEQQAMLVGELNKQENIEDYINDQHANHVLQKCIEVVPTSVIQFIYKQLWGHIPSWSHHNFGCRIVQRILEQRDKDIRARALGELRSEGEKLIPSTYGNYVAQHIIAHGDEDSRLWMKNLVLKDIRGYGRNKFASNVVEVCIREGTQAERRVIRDKVREEEEGKPPGETGLAEFLKCNYGNYVVRK
jgi:Pumilio-family RNA binding repeat